MFTRDRINLILERRGFEPDNRSKPHEILDILDSIAGVDTWGGKQYGVLSHRLVPVNGVGTRVSAHEKLITKPPPLVDDSCSCQCCRH